MDTYPYKKLAMDLDEFFGARAQACARRLAELQQGTQSTVEEEEAYYCYLQYEFGRKLYALLLQNSEILDLDDINPEALDETLEEVR